MYKIIEKKVKSLKGKYKTSNPFELCDYLNIKVLFEDLGENIKGFFQSAPKNKIIHINCRLDENSQLLTCAHELGHAIFHCNLNVLFLERNTFFSKNKFEIEANKFAAELLIDEHNIDKLLFENMTIEQISLCLNISMELVAYKFCKH